MNARWLVSFVLFIFLAQATSPMAQTALQDAPTNMQIAAQSTWVWDVNVEVSGGAEALDIASLGNGYALIVSHDGEGTVGNHTWTNENAGGKVVIVEHDGTIRSDNNLAGEPVMQAVHAGGLVIIAHTNTGIMLEAIDTLGVRDEMIGITSSSASSLNVHALTSNQDSAFFTVSCPTDQGLVTLSGIDCTLANGRQRMITMEWDLQANTTSIEATAEWFTPLTNGLDIGGENGAMTEVLGPNPDCTHALYATSTTLFSAANTHCDERDHNTASNAISLFGTTAAWSTGEVEASAAHVYAARDLSTGVDDFDAQWNGIKDCSIG
ncbi:MAG: hypothetical protein P8Q85_06980, partial [Candidatus Poseidoniaceae archaeon]|nr:hypothetical protein [Candidatus Poseidoniaceae archaeon]